MLPVPCPISAAATPPAARKPPLRSPIRAGPPPKRASESALVSENAGQVWNDATLATSTARRSNRSPPGSAVFLDDAQPLDNGMRPVRGVLAAFPAPSPDSSTAIATRPRPTANPTRRTVLRCRPYRWILQRRLTAETIADSDAVIVFRLMPMPWQRASPSSIVNRQIAVASLPVASECSW